MRTSIHDLLKKAHQPFSIIEEFAALSPKRKLSLCDRLFVEGREAYESTVRLLWPEATAQDLRKLENFLVLLKKTVH
jgi:hypothetical protein